MTITRQTNDKECGICVLTSLVKHLYKSQVDKIAILDQANISEQGLSLFEFENLALKLGMNVDTYELEWSEFLNYKTNDFLVIPIQSDGGIHYVIVKKHKRFITIYDSRFNEPINKSYDEFNKCFIKLVMVIEKCNKSFKFSMTSKIDLFKNLKTSFLIISILIQICIIALSTICANYLNMIVNDSISNSSIKNGLIITFVFALIFILNGFVKYVFKLFCVRSFKQCFISLSSNLTNALKIKKANFLNKIDKNNFYLVDLSMQTISHFITFEITMFCSNIFLLVVTLTVITCINPYFLIICITSIFTICIIGIIQYQFKKKMISIAIINQNINNNISRDYIEYLPSQQNFLIKNKLNDELKNNYFQYTNLYVKKTRFESGNSFISECFYNIIYLFAVMFATFLIVNYKNMNIGQLTFLIAILGMSHTSIEGICDFVIKKIEFKTMHEIYDSFILLSNEEINNKLTIEKINSIIVKTKDELIELCNGQLIDEEINKLIKCSSEDNDSLLINNVNINNINKIDFKDKLFCLNISTCIKPKWFLEKFNTDNKIASEALKLFQINLASDNLSLQQQTLLNLMYLSYLENKLIILEDNLRYLNKQQTQWFNKTLLPHIKLHNFVLFTQVK